MFGGREDGGMPESLKWEERVFSEAGSSLEIERGSQEDTMIPIRLCVDGV